MSVTRTSFNSSIEPNWREVDRVGSWLEDGRFGFVAFLDRDGYKAADNRDCNRNYDFESDWCDAFDEGYLLHEYHTLPPMTEEQFESLIDPDYGKSSVTCGPYFVDQAPDGQFTFHGPIGRLHGPEKLWDWTMSFDDMDRTLRPSWIYPDAGVAF